MSMIGLTVSIPIAFFAIIHFPTPKQPQGLPIRQGIQLIKELPLILLGLVLFFQSGMEITLSNWTSTFIKEELGIEADRAVLYLSFYWLGIVIARFALGFILQKIAQVRVLMASMTLAFLGALLMIGSQRLSLTLLGLFVIGGGFAAVFPIILGYVGELYPHLSGTAFSIVFVMALTGGMTAPFLTGVVAQSIGLRGSLLFIQVAIVAIVVLFVIVYKKFLTGLKAEQKPV